MRYTALCLLLVLASVQVPGALATANEPPVVDAGLDQSVTIGATVYLDAGGSYDPDGEIRSYEWTIRGPNGTRTAPDCPTCERTSFVPDDPGTYTVTVRATDDDGATRDDTLYVEASPGDGPTVTLSAPTSATAGDPVSVTASVDAGAASLDRLRWRVNGVQFGSDALDGDTATVSRTVPTAGDESLTVRAVVVDDAGLRATASTRIDVSAPAGDGSGGPTDPPETTDPVTNESDRSPGNDTGPVDSVSMTVDGPKLLTGDRPLRGNYSLAVDGGDAGIRSVGWYVDGELVGGGSSTVVTFDPGEHELIARVLTDEESLTVTFSDGSKTVVADPRPTVAFEQVSVDGTRVTGRASAIDQYGTLEGFHVAIGGTRIADSFGDGGTAPGPVRESLRFLPFERALAPNESYELSVTATDDRGQTHRITRTITTGSDAANTTQSEDDEPDPTIVSAEFVNGPVDSYHERIAPDRYLAEHVTRIDLDGADPAAVELVPKQMVASIRHFPDRTRKRYDELDDTLVVRSYFAAENPGEYEVVFSLVDDETSADRDASTFPVTPSKPEPRLDISRSGTNPDAQNWGMVVDASESFDPDGTPLSFQWEGKVQKLSPSIAKFDSMARARLAISDDENRSVNINGDFLDYFNPGIATIDRASVDSAGREGDVYFRISTPVYAFTKHNYDADLSISIAGDGRVVEWRNEEASLDGGGANSPGSAEDGLEQRYTGLVAIDRDEFEDGSVEVSIYNDAQPETTAMSYSATLTEGSAEETLSRQDLTIEDVQYEVKTDRKQRVVTPKPDKRAAYEDRGYTVVAERQDAIAYDVERASERRRTEMERQTFDSQQAMRRFLRTAAQEWRHAGTETTTERRRVTETVWRASKDGSGSFTGRTKQVLVPNTGMAIEREYVETVNKTLTVTKEVVLPTPAGPRFTEVTREKTVTRERTYWAKTPDSPDHSRTGATRLVPGEETLETRYEYEVERYEKKEVRRYVVERTVSQRETVWRDDGTVSATPSERQRIKSNEDLRITDTEYRTEWVLERNESRKTVVNEYRDEDDVTQTIVYVSGDLVRRNGTDGSTAVVSEFEERIRFDGELSKAEIREVLDRREGETECSGKDPITSGCGGYKNG